MRFHPSTVLLTSLLACPGLINANVLDCAKIVVDSITFDLHTLGGPHSVYLVSPTPTKTKNTTFTLDICQKLGRSSNKEQAEECKNGAQICALERFYNKDHKPTDAEPLPDDVWDIAGEFIYDNRHLDPVYTRLKGSDSHADSTKEGLRIEMRGGLHENVKQKAFVEFICDHSKTGLEGMTSKSSNAAIVRREGEEGGDAPSEELPNPNKGKALQLVTYREETIGRDNELWGVLRLEWATKYACESQKDIGDDKDAPSSPSTPAPKKRGMGFFTWFIVILFLGIAAYLIFGSWLNYSRYGARGWDLLPHGDALRDLPYLLKDWARRVMGTVNGAGNSRGYSAI